MYVYRKLIRERGWREKGSRDKFRNEFSFLFLSGLGPIVWAQKVFMLTQGTYLYNVRRVTCSHLYIGINILCVYTCYAQSAISFRKSSTFPVRGRGWKVGVNVTPSCSTDMEFTLGHVHQRYKQVYYIFRKICERLRDRFGWGIRLPYLFSLLFSCLPWIDEKLFIYSRSLDFSCPHVENNSRRKPNIRFILWLNDNCVISKRTGTKGASTKACFDIIVKEQVQSWRSNENRSHII